MNTIDKLRAEIERMKGDIGLGLNEYDTGFENGKCEICNHILSFLDTLEDPEPPTMGYDEAYLNEKIAKASKSWEGVDVDKFMDEIRGREPVTDCNDFDSLFDEFCDAHPDGMTLEECGRFFFSRGFSMGKMVATNDFDLALAQRYLTGYYDGKYEPVSEDLEEAAIKYSRIGYSPFDDPYEKHQEFECSKFAFIAGAEWMKAKMMEKEDGQ